MTWIEIRDRFIQVVADGRSHVVWGGRAVSMMVSSNRFGPTGLQSPWRQCAVAGLAIGPSKPQCEPEVADVHQHE